MTLSIGRLQYCTVQCLLLKQLNTFCIASDTHNDIVNNIIIMLENLRNVAMLQPTSDIIKKVGNYMLISTKKLILYSVGFYQK